MLKSHIIWGNYPETEDLIEELQQQELAIITVIDNEINSGLKRQGDIVYASKEYVEDARLSQVSQVTEFHYYYIAPPRRKDGVAWKVKKVNGLLHEFLSDKKC
ncbi:hypothetical protein MHZ92_11570 [Sporosarcina sp. ACRSL]|uniref:hypothetical protein n=1 Tax=Sporosarcina sp. ACRSL TaxID=2918215 RepID=UPI001EF535E5|nr:hypothetical protein [Sporosarcina sp. ACRSL]MCG7344777.1 hypothetical protein [Sporosarcina sp. ACRSL]